MENNFARPLDKNNLVFGFLYEALGLEKGQAEDATQSVMKAERLLASMKMAATIGSAENRHPKYTSEESRVSLREKIFEELRKERRLANDDDISLGNGGAYPQQPLKKEAEAFIVTGLPASGKSTVSNLIADTYGAYVIDSDYAKRKFPEYAEEYGASILHEESTLVTFGSPEKKYKDEPNLYEYCLAERANMVIPKIGHSVESIDALKDFLSGRGYKVHLTLVSLDRVESCKRALQRYLTTKRYVPLGLVFDVYANDPILTYYRIKDKGGWASTGKVATLQLRSKGPVYIEGDAGNPAYLFKVTDGVTK